jgi:hypothetical protein
MRRDEVARLARRISATFPGREYRPEWVDEALTVLEPYPAAMLDRAWERLKARGGPWPPSISELVAAAGAAPPDALSVLQALAGGGGDDLPASLRWRVLDAVGGLYSLRSATTADLERPARVRSVQRVIDEWYDEGGFRELVSLAARGIPAPDAPRGELEDGR